MGRDSTPGWSGWKNFFLLRMIWITVTGRFVNFRVFYNVIYCEVFSRIGFF